MVRRRARRDDDALVGLQHPSIDLDGEPDAHEDADVAKVPIDERRGDARTQRGADRGDVGERDGDGEHGGGGVTKRHVDPRVARAPVVGHAGAEAPDTGERRGVAVARDPMEARRADGAGEHRVEAHGLPRAELRRVGDDLEHPRTEHDLLVREVADARRAQREEPGRQRRPSAHQYSPVMPSAGRMGSPGNATRAA